MPPLLTPRPDYKLGKQSSKLKKNTLLFLKTAHQWFWRDLKINFASEVLQHPDDTCKTDLNQKCANVYFHQNGNIAAASCQPALAVSKTFNYESFRRNQT